MPVAIQIRDVPEEVRDVIARRAAQRGQSMQLYLLDLLREEARAARNAELFDQTEWARVHIPDHLQPERVVREGRERGFEVDRESGT